MKIRRRSHPLNSKPLTGKKEYRQHVKRMGRNFPTTIYNHDGVVTHVAFFEGKTYEYI